MRTAMFRMILVLIVGGSLCLAMPRNLLAEKADISKEELDTILRRLEQLTDRVEQLENQLKEKAAPETARPPAEGLESEVELLREDVEEMSGYLEETETRTLMDKLDLGAELRTRANWFRFEDEITGEKDNLNGLVSNRFRLNMRTEMYDNLSFHGRMTVFKNWLIKDEAPPRDDSDLNESRIPTDATVRLERAYVDYFFDNLPLAVTFGRLPVTDGMPTELREDSPRKSTYPSLAYDVTGDGAALTFYLDDWIPLPNPNLRVIYSRVNINDPENIYRDDPAGIDDMDILVTQLETDLPGRWLRDTLLIFNFLYLGDYPAPDLSDAGIHDVDIPESLGSFFKYTFFVESKRFLGLPIDWFAGYSLLETKVDGEPAVYDFLPQLGLLSWENTEDQSGDAFYAGVRFQLPFEDLNEPYIGVEYNHGSKYWFGLTSGSEDPLNKLDTRGDVWDLYYLQPINRHLYFRAGYTLIDYDYSGSGVPVGPPEEIDQKMTNTYILLDAGF